MATTASLPNATFAALPSATVAVHANAIATPTTTNATTTIATTTIATTTIAAVTTAPTTMPCLATTAASAAPVRRLADVRAAACVT